MVLMCFEIRLSQEGEISRPTGRRKSSDCPLISGAGVPPLIRLEPKWKSLSCSDHERVSLLVVLKLRRAERRTMNYFLQLGSGRPYQQPLNRNLMAK